MAELLLVSGNPKRRRRRRKMSALQRKYFGKKRRRKSRSHAAPARRRRRRHAVAAAPRRRRRRGGGVRRPAMGYTVGTKRIRRRKLNPHRRHYRRRHNPSYRFGDLTRQVMPTLKSGVTGATGALGLDALWGFVAGNATIGPYVSNPYVGFAAKAFGAVVVGSVGGRIMRGKGREMAVGAMTVVTHDFLKSLLVQMAPGIFGPGGSVPLGSYLSGSAPIVGTATVPQAYLPFSGMGSYLSGSGDSGMTVADSYTDDAMGMDPWGYNNH